MKVDWSITCTLELNSNFNWTNEMRCKLSAKGIENLLSAKKIKWYKSICLYLGMA
jgi:hypothetical protein